MKLGRMIMIALWLGMLAAGARAMDKLEWEFATPPESARPWVYWYFMDGNLTREGITADLEAMKRAGIGGAIFLEVGIGIPRGPVKFMSPEWRELFVHAAKEADRLGIELVLGAGPGWCGTGGPWVKPEQSMQHLVASETQVKGPARFEGALPRPQPRTPFFGEQTLTPELAKAWKEFYRDVAVLAFPTPRGEARIADVDEKALYYRAPYSSRPGVKPFLPEPAAGGVTNKGECIATSQVLDLTGKLGADGKLAWDAPAGEWTIMRLGRTVTGQTTRPAPAPGLGFESDKFDAAALDAHYEAFIAPLIKAAGENRRPGRGLTTLHFDSWEMSSQNWSERFREEFETRRGYDPLRYLPALSGRVVESREVSERFLWDLRQTAQELVVENHAGRLKELGRKHGLVFSIEPYDLNPCADLELGAVADVPMCEFWSTGHGFSTEFSCIEAASLAHTLGRPVVAAEAFTAAASEGWLQHPGSMKAQGDWAFCAGINRLAFHRYQHQPAPDRFPGMTMGPYGVHWESTQTWWPMVPAYHMYLARCQHLLRGGAAVADILYLAPEGAPHVFRAPKSALMSGLPDRRGYNFDGCAPSILMERAKVKDGKIIFPGGTSYRVMVLPQFETMTPKLMQKIVELAEAGATVIMSGPAPSRSPSLVGYPQCDEQVKRLAARLADAGRRGGKGRVIATEAQRALEPPKGEEFPDIYLDYAATARMLEAMGVAPDFESDGNLRYTHRRVGEAEVYFVGNRDGKPVAANCRFRVSGRRPEWWDPATGEQRELTEFEERDERISVPVRLEAHESGFVVFRKKVDANAGEKGNDVKTAGVNFPEVKPVQAIDGAWEVAFDPKWGGPEKVVFEKLEDWSKRPEPGIRNYSGRAVYRTTFDAVDAAGRTGERFYVSLGDVKVMASVRLNGKDLGVAWTAPWRVEIPAGTLKEKGNRLEITVANLWINRLIGDAALPKEKRLAWTTWNPYKPDSALQPSGLMGPVALCAESSAVSNR